MRLCATTCSPFKVAAAVVVAVGWRRGRFFASVMVIRMLPGSSTAVTDQRWPGAGVVAALHGQQVFREAAWKAAGAPSLRIKPRLKHRAAIRARKLISLGARLDCPCQNMHPPFTRHGRCLYCFCCGGKRFALRCLRAKATAAAASHWAFGGIPSISRICFQNRI